MSDRAIQEAIQILSGTHLADKVHFIDAVVNSVDENARTCIVVATSGRAGNQFTARLMAAVDDGILIIPAVGSTVVISYSDFVSPAVIQYSEVDRVILRGGDLGGLVKVAELTNKLNNLVLQLQAELVKIQTGITGVGGTYVPGQISQFVKSNYENDKIKHG